MANQLVYESRAIKKGGSGGAVASWMRMGIKHRSVFAGGKYWMEIMVGGGWRRCANVELPDDDKSVGYKAHPLDALCSVCGYLYAELMLRAGQPCQECGIDTAAARAARLESAGIPLGWSTRRGVEFNYRHLAHADRHNLNPCGKKSTRGTTRQKREEIYYAGQ